MPKKNTVKDNRKAWDEIMKAVDVKLPHAVVGVLHKNDARQHDDRGESNVRIAFSHEFGITSPERSFLRSTIDQNRGQYTQMMVNMAKAALKKNPEKVQERLKKIGEFAKKDIKKRIQERSITQDLTQETIDSKTGHSKFSPETAVVEYGDLFDAIESELRKT